jgi:hypothetical protein
VRREEDTVARGIVARIAPYLRSSSDQGKDRHKEQLAVTIDSPAAKDDHVVAETSDGVETPSRITGVARGARSRLGSLIKRWPGVVLAGVMAVLIAVGYLLAAPMGRDLSAQMAHAQLAESHWPEILNLRWYGGFNPLGYSVLSPPLMALLGVRLTTALGYVLTVVFFAALLKVTDVPRPVLGAVTGAVCLAGNLVVTRTTFELALAVGLGALLALVAGRLWLTSVLAVVAAVTSGVSGLFLGVAGGALFLSGRRREGVVLAISGMLPTIAVGLAFGNGGRQSFAEDHALVGFIVCLAVAGLCWRRPVVRWGALLSALLVVAAYLLPTQVGTTATRLPELFGPSVIMAVATVPLVVVVAGTVGAALLLPPVSITEVQERGDPALSAAFYAPLLDQLKARGVEGPIEVVATQRRGEAAFVPPVVPIARGWSRQIDIRRNPIFYDRTLNADTYRKWLDDNAISYVALSNGPYDWAASDEAKLLREGLPYLRSVWGDETWTLYAVTNPRPVISLPGQVIARGPASLTVSAPEPGAYQVRVRWYRYLSASDGCMRPAEGGWSTLVVERPGTVTINGSLLPRHC